MPVCRSRHCVIMLRWRRSWEDWESRGEVSVEEGRGVGCAVAGAVANFVRSVGLR
jgi:hypothetical protein